MSDRPTCDIDGCDAESDYLLAPEGNLCEAHATERHETTVAWLKATLGDVPPEGDAADVLADETGRDRDVFAADDKPVPELDDLEEVDDA